MTDVADDAPHDEAIMKLLARAKVIAAQYYRLTGKPLGVTGEVAEFEASVKLKLVLADARTPTFDAIKVVNGATTKYQIKGRAVASDRKYIGRVPRLVDGDFDKVLLVLLDRQSLDAIEIWEAAREECMARLDRPGSIARNERRSMAFRNSNQSPTRFGRKQ